MFDLLKGKTDVQVQAILHGMFMTDSIRKYLQINHPKLLEAKYVNSRTS